MTAKSFGPMEIAEVATLYQSGLSVQKIADLKGVSYPTASRALKAAGMIARRFEYRLRENYFDGEIHTFEQAYLLGLFLADGCNNPDPIKPRFSIELAASDKDLLMSVKELLYENADKKPLRFRDMALSGRKQQYRAAQSQYTLDFGNAHLSCRLAELGVVRNKTHITEFPYWLDASLYQAFILGYFDGDGSVSFTNSGSRVCFNIVGNEPLLLAIQEVLVERLGLNRTALYKDARIASNIKRLEYRGLHSAFKIRRFLYGSGVPICMARKHDKFFSLESRFGIEDTSNE